MVQVAKQWNADAIKHLLATNDRAVIRALQQLYGRQTATEQRCFTVETLNHRGFTAADAAPLSKLARLSFQRPLEQYEILRARLMLMKYTRQLLEIIVDRQVQKLALA